MPDIDIEFQHILLEIRLQRWAMLERFLFSYFCFKHGYLSKSGKPDWQQARECCRRSSSVTNTKHAELEPVVPLVAIIGELKRTSKQSKPNEEQLREILDSLLDYVVISKEEKQRLDQLGLSHQMPKNWYQAEEKASNARFELANILF